MAWEWVSPVGTGAAALVAASAAIWTARIGGRNARAAASASADRAERLADRERRAERRAEAYVEVLTLAEQMSAWASVVQPAFRQTPERPVPAGPELTAQVRGRALLGAHGSPHVRDLYEQYVRVVNNVGFFADQIESRRVEQQDMTFEQLAMPDNDLQPLWKQLEGEVRPKHRRLLEDLTEAINHELATPDTPGHVPAPENRHRLGTEGTEGQE